jgi:hypothetical protein
METSLAGPLLASSASRRSKLQDHKTPGRLVTLGAPARFGRRKKECEAMIFCEFCDGIEFKGLLNAGDRFWPGDRTAAP